MYVTNGVLYYNDVKEVDSFLKKFVSSYKIR